MLDTNILLDWLLDRNPKHTEDIDELFAKSEELHVPDFIFIELAFALEKFYMLPRNVVADNLNKVLDEAVISININKIFLRRAIKDYISSPALSFLDCCLIHCADSSAKLPVWTYDQKLINQSAGKAQPPT